MPADKTMAAGSRLAQTPVSSPFLTHNTHTGHSIGVFLAVRAKEGMAGWQQDQLTCAHLYTQPPVLGRANSIPYTQACHRRVGEGGKHAGVRRQLTAKDLSSCSHKTSIHSMRVCTHVRVHLCKHAHTHTGPGASVSHPPSGSQDPHSLVMSYTTTATVESRM